MTNDRVIKIATASIRTARLWHVEEVKWSIFMSKLSTPLRGIETLEQYTLLDKNTQDALKDVGGFVGGTFIGNIRKNKNLIGRDIITLDLDNIPAYETAAIIAKVESLGFGHVIYSTRKHCPTAPRLRIIMPIDRTCTPKEYEPIARKIGELIGIEYCDTTTFQPARLMYYPSACSDSEYIYTWKDNPFLSVDGLLATYTDWQDVTEWSHSASAEPPTARLGELQANPREKKGSVGAFCRVYDVHQAIAEFLPDVYEYFSPDRYTHVGGTSTGGARVLDDGDYLQSNHATDPTAGKMCNAFDLVRIHKFGHSDVNVPRFGPNSYTNPSHAEMRQWALTLPDVAVELEKCGLESAQEDYSGVELEGGHSVKLVRNKSGKLLKLINNAVLILEHDSQLKGLFEYDSLANETKVVKDMPWANPENKNFVDQKCWDNLQHYVEVKYGYSGELELKKAFNVMLTKNTRNPLHEYLRGLVWDGKHRAERVFVDYLGADDNEYTRKVSRMWLTGAVKRGLEAGCKFDLMLVFTGSQGVGKSQFILDLGKEFVAEDYNSFVGKEAIEKLKGNWLIEIGELSALGGRATLERVKQFITVRHDIYRRPYDVFPQKLPRSCAFVGTTNSVAFLQDNSGGRRFLPLAVDSKKRVRNPLEVVSEVDHIWAEVITWYKAGEKVYYTDCDPEYDLITQQQEEYREVWVHESKVIAFLEEQVPEGWINWSMAERLIYWGVRDPQGKQLVARDRICPQEIMYECLNIPVDRADNKTAREINDVIRNTKKWKDKRGLSHGYLGQPRGFERI